MVSTDILVWIGAILTIGIISQFWKMNAWAKTGFYTIMSIELGNLTMNSFKNISDIGISPLLTGDFLLLIPLIIGALGFSKYVPGITWLTRFPSSWMIGIGLGITMLAGIKTDIVGQLLAAIPVISGNLLTVFNGIVTLVAIMTVLTYFIFTRVKRSPIESILAKIGRYFLMVCLSLSLTGYSMSATTTWLGLVQFWLKTWLQI